MLRVGVDCGGTNTDAAVLGGGNEVLGSAKKISTDPPLEGIVAAIGAALRDAHKGARRYRRRLPVVPPLNPTLPTPCAEPRDVAAVMLGTTVFVNACVQLRGLARVAVVRLGGGAAAALPPFCSMPPALRAAVGGAAFLASGGVEHDGRTEIAAIDEAQLRCITRRIVAAGLPGAVVSGLFSPVAPQQEERAAAVLRSEAAAAAAEGGRHEVGAGQQPPPLLEVCLSHTVGQLGLLERENAAVLNTALLPLARRFVPACAAALAAASIDAPLLFCTNDGTLLRADAVLQVGLAWALGMPLPLLGVAYSDLPPASCPNRALPHAQMPIATFQSGPVNSLRGAALLTGLRDAAVLDLGSTTADIGLVEGGLPRPAARAALLAGAPTNFQMPDVHSMGLGGGSLLRFQPGGGCMVGPDSVGPALERRSLCFGGDTATASDAAALLGRMPLGSAAAAAAGLTQVEAEAAWAAMQGMLEGALERVKVEAGAPAPVCAHLHIAQPASPCL